MKIQQNESGNTLIIAVLTTALFSALVGIAVDYTTNVGRNAQRSRVIATAVEIGDGSLELAFASWRKICSSQDDPTAPLTRTNFSAITLPTASNFPVLSNFSVSRVDQGNNPVNSISNFKVEPVDPMLAPLPNTSPAPTPGKSTGPGNGTFSYFYLASADVKVPALKGSITAKVRRVFEQRITSPWNWAIMFNDNLELSPNSNLTLNGWVHTNGSLYTPSNNLTLTDRLSYVSDWNIGWDPADPRAEPDSGYTPTAPNYSAEFPPGFEQSYIPFGWDPSTLINTTDTGAGSENNDSYREIIEKAAAGTDPWNDTRLWNQAAIAVEVDANNNIKVFLGTGPNKTDVTGQDNSGSSGTANETIRGDDDGSPAPAVIPGGVIQDNREQSAIRVIDFDVARFRAEYDDTTHKSWNGIIYIRDTSAGTPVSVTLPGASAPTTTTKRAIRLINGSRLPSGGMTVASENPIYIKGDFNTGRTSSSETPSNTGTYTDPDVSGYTRQPALIAGDAVTLLSNNWSDANSVGDLTVRQATNTTLNAAIIAGNVPTGGGYYSGGAENFIRFLEDWETGAKTFTYYGSMIQFFRSAQANQPWGVLDTVYKPAALKWYFDSKLTTKSPPSTVNSHMATVSYLQQQRWFVTFQPNL